MSPSGPPEDDGDPPPEDGAAEPGGSGARSVFSGPVGADGAATSPQRCARTPRAKSARSHRGARAARAESALRDQVEIRPDDGEGRKLAARHLAYLERDGVERDGSPGRLYGADEKFSAEEFRERHPGRETAISIHRLAAGRRAVRPDGIGPAAHGARSRRTRAVASSGRR